MIISTYRMKVRPEKRDEFLKMVCALLNPMAADAGFVRCHFYQDFQNEHLFNFVGMWDSQEDLGRHVRIGGFRLLILVDDLLQGPVEIDFHSVAESTGIDTMAAAFDRAL
jgi:quinol monooxygenase YgiN